MPKVKPVARPKRWLWNVDDYLRLGEKGFFRNQRVELIEGVIYQMPPMLSRHATAILLAQAAAAAAFGRGHHARTQLPLQLGPRSAPEPDVAVVVGTLRANTQAHPTTALLIIEASDTSLWYDRRRKGSLYARAGIADYWIVNLRDNVLEVRRRPVPDATAHYGHSYADLTTLRAGDTVTPLAAPQATIAVADLLP
jgi:Uma2 family endonuclease